ncbi:MAG: replisome organizer, partial [Clostridiales bacterium]|nr:replisome organizer [Clostridiales bacterium]
PRRIIKSCGCKTEDLKILEKNGFIIIFDSGVLVIRDWKLNNTLKNDRYHPTVYNEEYKHLETDSNGRYNKKA